MVEKKWELKNYNELQCNDIYRIGEDEVYETGVYICVANTKETINPFDSKYFVKKQPWQAMKLLDAYIVTLRPYVDGLYLFPSEISPFFMDNYIIDAYKFYKAHDKGYYKSKKFDIDRLLLVLAEMTNTKLDDRIGRDL